MISGYDVIGDVHGHADKLEGLLRQMGYDECSGKSANRERQAIFVGDLIDRGKTQRRTPNRRAGSQEWSTPALPRWRSIPGASRHAAERRCERSVHRRRAGDLRPLLAYWSPPRRHLDDRMRRRQRGHGRPAGPTAGTTGTRCSLRRTSSRSRTSDPARRDDGSIQSTRPCHTLRSHCSCRVSGKEAAGWTATGRINNRVDVSTIVRSVASYAS